jgi:hypothetical protein
MDEMNSTWNLEQIFGFWSARKEKRAEEAPLTPKTKETKDRGGF